MLYSEYITDRISVLERCGLLTSAKWAMEWISALKDSDLSKSLGNIQSEETSISFKEQQASLCLITRDFHTCTILADSDPSTSLLLTFMSAYAQWLSGARESFSTFTASLPKGSDSMPSSKRSTFSPLNRIVAEATQIDDDHTAPLPFLNTTKGMSDVSYLLKPNANASQVLERLTRILPAIEQVLRGNDLKELPKGKPVPNHGLVWWLAAVSARDLSVSILVQRLMLMRAVLCEPLLWAAWEDLSTTVRTVEETQCIANELNPLVSMRAPGMVDLFLVRTCYRLRQSSTEICHSAMNRLLQQFPTKSPALFVAYASFLYDLRDVASASNVFEELESSFPTVIEGMAAFSDVLYVLQNRNRLVTLARRCFRQHPFTAETHLVAGNLFALMSQPDVSSRHFYRAVQLQPDRAMAWLLLGHSCMEIQDISAAQLAYRTAIHLNPLDFRAWYSLGQFDELRQLPLESLMSYWRAISLQPKDGRVWIAISKSLTSLSHLEEAATALIRASHCPDISIDLSVRLELLQRAAELVKENPIRSIPIWLNILMLTEQVENVFAPRVAAILSLSTLIVSSSSSVNDLPISSEQSNLLLELIAKKLCALSTICHTVTCPVSETSTYCLIILSELLQKIPITLLDEPTRLQTEALLSQVETIRQQLDF